MANVSVRWDVLPYAVGALWIAFFSASLGHLCSRGSDPSFPHVARGTPRFHYCYVAAPIAPWLLVLLGAGAVLAASAFVFRGRRLAAWGLVCALVVAMLLYEDHVRGLSEYLTLRT